MDRFLPLHLLVEAFVLTIWHFSSRIPIVLLAIEINIREFRFCYDFFMLPAFHPRIDMYHNHH